MLSLFVSFFLFSAQAPRGEIRLSVQDSSAAPMRAAGRLNATPFATDAQGRHTFGNLPYGRYRLEVNQTGFAAESMTLVVDGPTPVLQVVKLGLGQAANSVTVIGTTPLAGTGVTRDELPVTAQTANALDFEQSGALNLADFISRRLNGV